MDPVTVIIFCIIDIENLQETLRIFSYYFFLYYCISAFLAWFIYAIFYISEKKFDEMR